MIWLASVLTAAALAQAPQAPPAVPVQTAGTVTQKPAQGRQMQKNDKNSKDGAPDMDLIGYLGEYEDAADGLDPMGLAERPDALKNQTDKDGHQP